ncbi:Protein T06D8.2 [Aphelenchoides avenae]|nr:Protein T06D8.2 [Aphelenchus avenae]
MSTLSKGNTLTSRESRMFPLQKSEANELRELFDRAESKKVEAVKVENYALAKKAQRAAAALKVGINQITELEREKRRAILAEDYDHAQELSEEIAALKANTVNQTDTSFLEPIPSDPRPATTGTSASSILSRFAAGKMRLGDTMSSLYSTNRPKLFNRIRKHYARFGQISHRRAFAT